MVARKSYTSSCSLMMVSAVLKGMDYLFKTVFSSVHESVSPVRESAKCIGPHCIKCITNSNHTL